jgi:hypothetical protein
VLSVLEQILACNFIVSIVVQFPESAVEDVKVLVGEVFGHLVDVFFVIHLLKDGEEVRFANLTRGNASRVTEVDTVKDACDDCDCVLVLEFGVVG